MNTIPITTIVVPPRQRRDMGDLASLADSIRTYGIIQPLVLSQDNTLIAGERRLRAAQAIGLTEVPYVVLETLTDAQRSEMEYEENVRRKSLVWTEQVCAIAHIHEQHSRTAGAEGTEWGYAQTGELLGVAKSHVWYSRTVADLIHAGDKEIIDSGSLPAALQVLADRKLREASTALAKTMPVAVSDDIALLDAVLGEAQPTPDLLPRAPVTAHNTEAIAWLRSQRTQSIDCIYTDPPYAIDMDMLSQEQGGINITQVEHTHQVESNLELLAQFVEQTARVLRPARFCVLWTDQMTWNHIYTCAEAVGLRVQRWPLVWVKTHQCINQSAAFNFTKATEIAMVLSTHGATLRCAQPRNYWTGPSDKDAYGVTNPFWKPISLHQWIISAIINLGMSIIDPFAGCGSIPLAASKMGIPSTAIEVDPVHYVKLCQLCGLNTTPLAR